MNVREVYEKIAIDFDRTRWAKWKCVKTFLGSLDRWSIVGDIGCGNGKYLDGDGGRLVMMGCDLCGGLLECASKREVGRGKVARCDGRRTPWRDGVFDATICIAVLHHLHSVEERRRFVKELARVLKVGGRGVVTVWVGGEKKGWVKGRCEGDWLVPFNGEMRYYYVFTKEELVDMFVREGLRVVDIYFEMDNWCLVYARN